MPYGIPLVALGYWAAVMVAFLLVGALPLVGQVLAALPWPVRLILLPGLVTRALCHQRADGRPAHEAMTAYLAFTVSAKHLVGLAPAPHHDSWLGSVAIAADEYSEHCPRGILRGPCTVVLRRPARLEVRTRAVSLTPLDHDGELRQPHEVTLPAGTRMEVAACARR